MLTDWASLSPEEAETLVQITLLATLPPEVRYSEGGYAASQLIARELRRVASA